MIFKSGKAVWVSLLIWGVVALMVFNAFQVITDQSNDPFYLIFTVLITAFLLWIWFGTYYIIDGQQLKYRSGPINGSIPVASIRKITTGKTSFIGLKPSLDTHGCVLAYNKYDEIYLSPKNQDLFVQELVKINPAIEVVT
ncbi:PH domain-containing protein [Mucilaginibacter sp. CSA2-8R]|uniref:PH domain-containing protein n=1 Tax=Mucilaginibacter sp. CSA2-8R TaxID=3141542 RepID=UPI00315CC8E8